MNLPHEMEEFYKEISSKSIHRIKIYEPIREIIQKLIREGCKCALFTGKDRARTFELLDHLNLNGMFQSVVCSEDVDKGKPNPEGIYKIIEKLGGKEQDYVMIGDAANDIRCAKSAGICSMAVTWGAFDKESLEKCSPDLMANNPLEMYRTLCKKFQIAEPSKKFLINDLVIGENYCNMKCQYCLTSTSKFENDRSGMSRTASSYLSYTQNSPLKYNVDSILDTMHILYDIPILKVSGGEILIVKHICDFIEHASSKYKVVQVLSNGLSLNSDIIRRLAALKNICIQISLDHHTVEGNCYRGRNEKNLHKILKHIDSIVKYGIPLEINCVLTDKNTHILDTFADYLLKYEGRKVMLLPFPVRGSQRDKYLPNKNQWMALQKLIDQYEKYKAIMVPQIYLELLLSFLKNGKRQISCALPSICIGTFDTGVVTPCSNYWFLSMGSILGNDMFSTIDNIENHKIYSILSNPEDRLEACRLCFTPWEILNLYIKDMISFEELTRAPLYSFESIKSDLLNLKKNTGKRLTGGGYH